MDSVNIVAIVQARMGSERLPGKVLLPINNKPVLWHIVDRLEQSKFICNTVIACPDNTRNQPIKNMAKQYNISCFAGSEKDLIDRIYQAALEYNADVVVWITGDCPLIDTVTVDNVIQIYLDGDYDVVTTGRPNKPRCIPDGLDTMVISFDAVQRLWEGIRNPYDREWWTVYLAESPDYKYYSIPCHLDLTHLRWTLDTPEDYEFIKRVMAE